MITILARLNAILGEGCEFTFQRMVLKNEMRKHQENIVFNSASNFMNGIFNVRTRRNNGDNNNCAFYENIDFEQNDLKIIQNVKSVQDCCYVLLYIPSIDVNYGENCYFKCDDLGKKINNWHISGSIGNNSNGKLDY